MREPEAILRESSTLLRLRNVPARRRRTRETATVVFGPVAVLLLLNLIYAAFGDGWFDSTGWIELVLWPAGAMLLGQLAVSAFARDVAEKKVEMLEVCGASREAYLAAFLVEFAAVGLLGAAVAATFAAGFGLFRGASFFLVLGLLVCFNLATVANGALGAAVAPYDARAPSASAATQGFLLWQTLGVALFFLCVVDMLDGHSDAAAVSPSAQYLACLHPMAALLLGADSFRGPLTNDRGDDAPYTGVTIGGICKYVRFAETFGELCFCFVSQFFQQRLYER